MTFDDFLTRFEGVRRSGHGYVARCTAHDDREASLSLAEEDGKILVHCFAGCKTEDIVDAVGLQMSDLMLEPRKERQREEPEAVYDYTDEEGGVLFQAVRFPSKRFRQRHWSREKEDWEWNLDGVRRVLYHLPEVQEGIREGKTIYLVEGEKDVESLRAIGKVATCNPMGAGKWRPEYTLTLAGANVVIVADRDEPGRLHAETVKIELDTVCQNVWIYQPKEGKDVTDHLLAGHPIEELQPLKQAVRRGIMTAKELAEQGAAELSMTEADMPSYEPWECVPVQLRPGRVYTIGAYTGDGKTTMAIQGFRRLGEREARQGYHSLEMTSRDLRNKLLVHEGIPLRLLENPWLLKGDPMMAQLHEEGLAEIATWNSDVIFDSATTAEKIYEITRDREHEVVWVDHLHRFSWGSERRKLDEQVNILTNMALELNVVVILLCQLRKYTKGRDSIIEYPQPTLQDFRETSMIGDDTSMAFAVWRQREDGLRYTGLTEVILLKNRHTTGHHDKAGTTWLPNFDEERQMLVKAGT